MTTPRDTPHTAHAEDDRRRPLVRQLVRAMAATAVAGVAFAFAEPSNDLRVTFAIYAPLFAGLFALDRYVQRGSVQAAAWALTVGLWGAIAGVTGFIGGLHGSFASMFAVAVLVAGGLLGSRPALGVAAASAVWTGLIALLEVTDRLPEPVTPYSPINSWVAIAAVLALTARLLQASLDSLERARQTIEQRARERDEALRRSIQAQKMELVGTLSAGIAHDFNNLLTVMTGTSALLKEQLPDQADLRESLEDLDAATSQATLMTRQLLRFGRSDGTDLTVIDVSRTLQQMSALLKRLVGAHIRVVVDVAPGLTLFGSVAGLEQIVLNLAVNARDAMPAGGQINLSARRDGAHVHVVVRDTGVGIPSDTRQRMFEPFFTTKRTGTGLGLATVHELVQVFSGTIQVESEPGRGAAFILRFPFADPPALPHPVSASLSPDGVVTAKKRVLLVDDDVLVRRTTARVLERHGFDVVSVSDGEEALALLDTATDIAAVVTDLSMPRLSGLGLSEALLRRRPALPLLLVSGVGPPDPSAFHRPHRTFLPKPVLPAKLCATVDALIDGRTP